MFESENRKPSIQVLIVNPYCIYIVYILCICCAYVMHMLCICCVNVMYMLCTCCAYAMHMLCICCVYVVYMSCICCVYVVHVSCICRVYANKIKRYISYQSMILLYFPHRLQEKVYFKCLKSEDKTCVLDLYTIC